MVIIDQSYNADKKIQQSSTSVRTTLYELISAINEEISSEEDWVVTQTVLDLFIVGQAKFLS